MADGGWRRTENGERLKCQFGHFSEPKYVPNAVSLNLHAVPFEPPRLRVVKRIPSNSLKDDPLPIFCHKHDRLMFAPGSSASELSLDFASQVLRPSLPLRHTRSWLRPSARRQNLGPKHVPVDVRLNADNADVGNRSVSASGHPIVLEAVPTDNGVFP